MSQLSRQINTFCRENPTADTCRNIDSVIPYFSIAMILGGILGTAWILFKAEDKDFNGIGKLNLVKRLAFSSLPLFITVLGYQAVTDPNGTSDSLYYVFLLTIPAIIKHRKGLLKWIAEAYNKPS